MLKYPHDATPIPGPHLGRSELFNRSVSATTNERSLSRFVFSLFLLLLLLLCIYSSRYSSSSRREKSSFFWCKNFSSVWPFLEKGSKKGRVFSDFSQNNKNKQQTLINAQISSHRLIFTVLLVEHRLIALWICYLSERTLLRVRGWFDEKFCRARKRRTETRYSQRRKNLNWWGRCVGDEWGWWWFWFSSKRRSFSRT